MNEDICLSICKLLKQLKTVTVDENELLFNDQDSEQYG